MTKKMSKQAARLGVNIDHVATLRQAREENYPSLIDAARLSLKNGADQITIHLREDRRHIQDFDVSSIKLVTGEYGRPLNLEMGCNMEVLDIAISAAPEWVCLVPEKREEKTTEGGLNLLDEKTFNNCQDIMLKLRQNIANVKVSLFLESSNAILDKAAQLAPEAVEIHTGDFARSHLQGEDLSSFIETFKNSSKFLKSKDIKVHAGHGLTYESTEILLKEELFEEYNIGHFLIAQSIFQGLGPAVKKMSDLVKAYPLEYQLS